MIYRLGAVDTTQTQGDINITLWNGSSSVSSKNLTNVNYMAVRFESCAIGQTPTGLIEVTLSGVVTE